MSEIAKIVEDGAKRIGKSLGQDTGQAVKKLYHQTGDNLERVVKNHVENDAKHADELKKLHTNGGKDKGLHPGHSGPGGDGKSSPGGKSGGKETPPGGDKPKSDGSGSAKKQAGNPDESGRTDDSICPGGEPVDMATGRMFMNAVDVSLPGALPLLFTRSFESGYQAGRWMGERWVCTFDERLERDEDGVVYLGADRVAQVYPHPVPGGGPVQASAGARWDLEVDEENGGYTLTDLASGRVREFTPSPASSTALLTRLRDRAGRCVDFAYDTSGTPVSITHHAGYRLLVTVDRGRITAVRLADAGGEGHHALLVRYGYTDGRLTAVYNPSGEALRFSNDTHGRITSWTDRNGSHYTYTYDELGRVVEEGGARGSQRFHFRYGDPDPDTGIRINYETNAHGHTSEYHINHRAQVVAQVNPLGHTTRTEYDEYHRVLAHTDALDRTTRYEYDGLGEVTALTRPDGERIQLAYHGMTSLPTEIELPGGAVWRQEYDRAHRRTAAIDPTGSVTRYGYDEQGNLAAITDALGRTTRFRCDPAGLPVEVTAPDGSRTSCERDAFGRTTAVTDALGGVTRFTWTAEGQLASRQDPDGTVESWTWDGEGNNRSHTDKLGQVSTFEYNDFDRVCAARTPEGSRFTFTWDAELQLVAVTNPLGQQWTYTYDAAGRLTSETDFHGRTVSFGWTAGPRPVSRTDAQGRTVRHQYDLLDRLMFTESEDAVTTYAYDVAGHLIRAANADCELSRTVDALGNILTETVDGRTVTHTWDALGRRTSRALPSGHTSSFGYDAAGNRAWLQTADGRLDFGYDPAGLENHRALSAQLTLSSVRDAQHRITAQTLQTPDQILQSRSYTYRADGHPTRIEDQSGRTRDFLLGPTGRVTSVLTAGREETYAYDPGGHLTTATWPATEATRPALGERVRSGGELTRAGGVRYEYDSAGRVTMRQVERLSRKPDTWRFTWDPEDRLTQVRTPDGTRWRYRYDPLGRRVSKERLGADGSTVEERTDFTWDGPRIAEQTTHSPALPGPHALSWDHDGFRPLAQTETITDSDRDRTDRRFYAIVTDLVGTPTELVDPTDGTIAWRANTTLWGHTTWPRDSTTYTPLRFPGQYFDPETRLHYNYHRYYDPATARYTSPDPLGLAPAANPDTYVHNPLISFDPLGLAPCENNGVLNEHNVADPNLDANGQAFLNHIKTTYQGGRLDVERPWNSNFAVLHYRDNTTGLEHYRPAFNTGGGLYHSEESIVNGLHADGVTNYKPLNLFTDRQPCGNCWSDMSTAFRPKVGSDPVNVYFISEYRGLDRAARNGTSTLLKHWWN
ncbi:DUF6531 domain-containing protein [Kitasatospora sp. GAS1066B]|uniref:DUF6531 domain-containing protein n=1 Tax=Kitasatospora sp. GAS1066B TaxID=3156271 RepID=UPI003519B16B